MVTIWNATYGDEATDSHIHGDIVRILMLTDNGEMKSLGCNGRRSISIAAPGNYTRRTKNKQPHIVLIRRPSCRSLRRQLKEQTELGLESAYVFTTTAKRRSPVGAGPKRLDQRCGAGRLAAA